VTPSRLTPGSLVLPDVSDGALESIRGGEHCGLDDGVVRGVEAGSLAADVEPAPTHPRAGRVGMSLKEEGVEGAGVWRVDVGGHGGWTGYDMTCSEGLGQLSAIGGSLSELRSGRALASEPV